MKIAVEGCAHGELEKIYETLQYVEKQEGIIIDLLICCGDFQATRNEQDLSCMAVSQKYRNMCSFYKYYSGEKEAPVLTIFIGGNHEASNYLQELSYGGWVAPNIYYLGYAGVVNIGGIRIAGLSGIYKSRDYMRGHYEMVPYTEESKRSVYHIRNLEVFRLKQLSQPVDVILSHDWPRGVTSYGNTEELLEKKPFFKSDIEENRLGSKPAEELLNELKPRYWFAAHLHCKFSAVIRHGPRKGVTKFLALDKCLPRRQFLQVFDLKHETNKPLHLNYDLEWLTIVYLTNHLLSVKKGLTYMPGRSDEERWIFTPSEEEKNHVLKRFEGDLKIPLNFTQTVPPFSLNSSSPNSIDQLNVQLNPQTITFCERLGIDDPLALLLNSTSQDNTMSPFSLPSCLTPERPGDISCVSFTGDEGSSLDSSFDDISRSSPGSQPIKLFSMSLPLPKLVFSDENSDDFIPLSQMTQESSKELESNEASEELAVTTESQLDDSMNTSQIEESNQLDESINTSEIEESNQLDESMNTSQIEESEPVRPPKKFKRRNKVIYSNTDDD